MKGYVSAVVLAAVSLVSGQNFGAEPSCAIPCLTSAISVAGCALTDQACQCGTGKAAIQTAVTPCLLTACSPGDLGIAASVGQALCSAYSLTATGLSGTVTTTATTSLASSSSAPSSTIIISTPSATKTSTVTAVTTSVASTNSSVAATTSKASTSSAKSNSTGSATSSAASVVSSAGAGQRQVLGAGLGGVVGVLGAVVAAL